MTTPAQADTERRALQTMVHEIRTYLRDFPELNRLIDGVEHSDRAIAWAVLDTLVDFNGSPPLIGDFVVSSFPNRTLLKNGAIYHLLRQIGLLMARNLMSFSDGGLTVNVEQKSTLMMQWAQWFAQEYKGAARELKMAINIQRAWGGGAFSEYSLINSLYGSYLYTAEQGREMNM